MFWSKPKMFWYKIEYDGGSVLAYYAKHCCDEEAKKDYQARLQTAQTRLSSGRMIVDVPQSLYRLSGCIGQDVATKLET